MKRSYRDTLAAVRAILPDGTTATIDTGRKHPRLVVTNTATNTRLASLTIASTPSTSNSHVPVVFAVKKILANLT